MLAAKGAASIDADLVYRDLVQPGESLLPLLVAEFGNQVVASDGSLDRSALRRIVFNDPAQLIRLDQLTHPAVVEEIQRRQIESVAEVGVIDAVKLFESGLADLVNETWQVVCAPEKQIARLMKRNHIPFEEATHWVDAQSGAAEVHAAADVTVDNSGSLADTQRQVDRHWNRIVRQLPESD